MLSKTPTFQNFWEAYDYKRDRLRAERAWNRLSTQDKRNAVAAIAAYREDCERRGISRMYAQGYLNNHRWEDDFTPLSHPITQDQQSHSATTNKGMVKW